MALQKSYIRRFIFTVFVGTLVLGFAPKVLPQDDVDKKRPANNRPQASSRSKNYADLTEWKFLLDNLAIETRTLEPEQERPLLIAELADAYWLIDQKQAKNLFIDALDRSLSLPTEQKPGEIIAKVLSLAAKRDRALAVSLTTRLRESRDKGSSTAGQALRVAGDLLESDPGLAVELAQAASSAGPSMSSLWFLFKLAEKDPAAAEKLYDVYLKRLLSTRNPDLESVLWLAGYPLGYGEAYGGSIDPVSFTGFGGLRTPGLNPHPAFARAYLQLAFESITNTLRAAAGNDSNRDVLNSLALFGAAYLFPEVQRYLPNAEGLWSNLYRQSQTGTTEARRLDVEKRLQSILEVRTRTSKYESTDDYLSGDAKERLDQISKLAGGCKRDQAYAEVAFNFGYSKKFFEAQQMADQIGRLSLRENVLQFINYDVAGAAIDSGNLVEAPALAEKVVAKNQRALLFVKIAVKSLKSGDKSGALDLLNRARALVRDSDDPGIQASVLLAAASVYGQFDPLEATVVMREAIKAVNHVKDRGSVAAFSILRRVDFGCEGEDRWYGGRERAETFSLYETLAAIAVSDVQGQGALSLASELEDKPTRVRAQLSVIKAVMK